ncbi:hypothetical protein LIA77_06277 [Sarocladium implicatum]|nr:hypothetical protein LIA77_06277 [Sarocladium implicatum]
MSNLPEGAFLTNINGKQCTAVPRNPRSAAPDRPPSSAPEPARTTRDEPARTTADQLQPTQTEIEEQRPPEPPTTEAAPEPLPTSAPDLSPTDVSEVVSSESTLLEEPSTSEEGPSNLPIPFTTSSSTSTLPVETQSRGDENEPDAVVTSDEEPAEPSTSASRAPSVIEDSSNVEPSSTSQGPVSLDVPLLAGPGGESRSSTLLSTATFIASVSLASPSVTSFFSSPPSPTGTGNPESPFPSSFTAILRPSISLPDEESDRGNLILDTTPLPDRVVTRVDGKITTIGLAATTAKDLDELSETNTVLPDSGVVQQDKIADSDAGPNAALIGGIAGGVVGLALAAFLLWWCMRRRRRNRESRFSTSLNMPPGAEKRRTYEFDTGSVGPTPRRQRFAATLDYHANKFGWSFFGRNQSSNSVNMNRGNSQFFEGLPSHSRGNSTTSLDGRANLSRKDRFFDWWSRLKEDVNFNWRLRNGRADNWAARNMMEKDTGDMEPDFLTLLAKDEKRRSGHRSMHSRGASVTSIDRFLGDLGMDWDNSRGADPFADTNAAPAPKPSDPFSDVNVVQQTQKPPKTYVTDVRRSRGASVGGAVRASNMSSVYRDSVRSDDSFGTRRNKFRSDPFDLELDHRRLPSYENVEPMPTVNPIYGLPPRPTSLKQGHDSYTSSRYTKSSIGDWSDPGPDIGPSRSTVATSNSPTSIASGAATRDPKARHSGGSQNSTGVGKAM